MTNKNILDYFPSELKHPRPSQITALNWLAEQDAKYILLEAPVGSGKSAIGICYSKFLNDGYGDSFILTPQRILQDQYVRTFVDGSLSSLYGKSNYSCHPRHTTCNVGSIIKPKCGSGCPYVLAVTDAKRSPNSVLNYTLAALMFAYTTTFDDRKRQLMILDECHTVEEHLTEFHTIFVSHKRAKLFGLKEWPEVSKMNIFLAKEWMTDVYLPYAKKYLGYLHSEIEPLLEQNEMDCDLTKSQIKKIEDYSKLQDYVEDASDFSMITEDELVEKYVLIFDKESFKFKMLTGAENFRTILKPHADKFLFMSSTILDKNGFAEDLGLPPDETAFLSLDSEFPIENRPIYFIPRMRMNASWKDASREAERKGMIEGLKIVLGLHPTDSGIIHTANYAIAMWLIENLELWPESTHEFIHHNPSSNNNRNDVIHHFMSNDIPSVLISPSITEGLDLVDDIARFAIFCKVPFGYLGDQWIKRRLQLSKEWYQRRALIDIIQGGGRIVRSKNDKGVVYILDESWGYLISQTINKIPGWWKKAYNKI